MSLTIATVIAVSSQSSPMYFPQCINSKVFPLESRLYRLVNCHPLLNYFTVYLVLAKLGSKAQLSSQTQLSMPKAKVARS